MYISGSIGAFNAVFQIAQHLHAESIQFFSPNHVLIVAKNKEDYVYAKTTLSIGYSVFVPRTHYRNMYLYLNAAKKGRKNPQSMFYQREVETALFSANSIRYNDSQNLVQSVQIESLQLEKEVELKFEESMQSSYHPDTPYLRLSDIHIQTLHKEMSTYKRQYKHHTQMTPNNALHIVNGELVWVYEGILHQTRIETGIDTFIAHPVVYDQPVFFPDKAFYLFNWLKKLSPVDEVIFLPRTNYCVVEGYTTDMVSKVRMKLRG